MGLRFNCDYIDFFTRNSDIRRRWCPSPGLYFIAASLQLQFHTDVYQAAKDVSAEQGTLIDIFERIENFFKRLEIYTKFPPPAAITDIIVKIMVEVLNVFAIATKVIRQGQASELYVPICLFISVPLIVHQRSI